MSETVFPLQQVIAYRTRPDAFPLVSASSTRDWMMKPDMRFSNRCLPLRVANAIGWDIINPKDVTVEWDGKKLTSSDPQHANLHFGERIVTLNPGYVFRTDPGWGLWIKGVANVEKGVLQNLEAVIESDQLPYAIGVSFRFVASGGVRLKEGARLAQIVPIPLSATANASLRIRNIEDDPVLLQTNRKWGDARRAVTGTPKPWHGFYVRGDDCPFPHHRLTRSTIQD